MKNTKFEHGLFRGKLSQHHQKYTNHIIILLFFISSHFNSGFCVTDSKNQIQFKISGTSKINFYSQSTDFKIAHVFHKYFQYFEII